MKTALLSVSASLMGAGLICLGALAYESATGALQDRPSRATALFFSGLALSHVAVAPLAVASRQD